MEFQPLEAAVLEKLLSGPGPVLAALRRQLAGASVKRREFSGVGFFTEIEVCPGTPQAGQHSGRATLSDVDARIDGLREGAGFVLFVEGGFLSMLEGYSYDEPWPNEIRSFSLEYREPSRKELLRTVGEI